MKYERIHARELTPELAGRWADIQQDQPELASPYFRPEFTQAVADVRNDVYLGLVHDGPRVVGFFPHHRARTGRGRPIGLGLSDYHGLIAEPHADWQPEPLLRACRLVRWEFDHLLASQTPWQGYHQKVSRSPIIQLADGYDAYEASRGKSSRKQIREADRKRDKLEQQGHHVRFLPHTDCRHTLHTLMQWKSAQCRRTGVFDYFALPWCRQLIERIHESQTAPFAGLLACLYADDTLIAAHFAMRSDRVWHSWFPVYSHDYQAYSPGMILLLEMIRHAARSDVDYIDLGKGMSTYKEKFMTDAIHVATGEAALPAWRNRARTVRTNLEHWARHSLLHPLLRAPGRVVRGLERRSRYES